jgi:hypothetical protein
MLLLLLLLCCSIDIVYELFRVENVKSLSLLNSILACFGVRTSLVLVSSLLVFEKQQLTVWGVGIV